MYIVEQCLMGHAYMMISLLLSRHSNSLDTTMSLTLYLLVPPYNEITIPIFYINIITVIWWGA